MTSLLGLKEICQELGLEPQFLFRLSEVPHEFYETFYVPKRSGGYREITASQTKLKRIQRILLDDLFSKFRMPDYVHGCVKGRSVVTNAGPHIRQSVVMNIDLQNFFGSISFERVKEILAKQFELDDVASDVIARICTLDGRLPQGAPTSPVLANIAALDMDRTIIQLLENRLGIDEFQFTRYVDDITISGDDELAELMGDVHSAINDCNFQINKKKSRILRQSMCQKVTGVVVNAKLSPPKKILRKLRQQLYYCNKFGLSDFCKHEKLDRDVFVRKLRGSISYIRLTRPEFADHVVRELGRNLPIWHSMDEEERTVRRLSQMINDGKIAYFFYENIRCRVAPAEIGFDDDKGIIVVKGFQLFPDEGWRTYLVNSIRSLEVQEEESEPAGAE